MQMSSFEILRVGPKIWGTLLCKVFYVGVAEGRPLMGIPDEATTKKNHHPIVCRISIDARLDSLAVWGDE